MTAGTRWWQWRLALLLLVAWDVRAQLADPERGSLLFGGITFGSHEFGHLVWAFLGEFMAVAGGSLTQLLLPLLAGVLLARQRDAFGVSIAGLWLASSLVNLAQYVGDARAFELDLVGFGEDPQHDWAYLLGHFGALQHDTLLAAWVRGAGALVGLAAMGLGGWACLRIWRARRAPAAGEIPA